MAAPLSGEVQLPEGLAMEKFAGILLRNKHRAVLSTIAIAMATGCGVNERVVGFVNEDYTYAGSSASRTAEEACRTSLQQTNEASASDIKSCMEGKGWTYIDRTERRAWFGFGGSMGGLY